LCGGQPRFEAVRRIGIGAWPKTRVDSRNTTAKPALAFEATLWAAADKLRGNMDAAEYKHVALGLIFLKYISDRFEERRRQALADPEEQDLVDERDLYLGDNVFWVPERARWDFLKSRATSVEPTIGALIDQAMIDLEAENPSLRGVLTKNLACRPTYAGSSGAEPHA
jgi:type I restriction enzyme M protein